MLNLKFLKPQLPFSETKSVHVNNAACVILKPSPPDSHYYSSQSPTRHNKLGASRYSRMLINNKRRHFHTSLSPVFRIRVWIRIRRIHIILGLLRIRNLFVRIRIRILPSTSKKMKQNLDFYCFVTSL